MFILKSKGLIKVVVCVLIAALLTTSFNIPSLQTTAQAAEIQEDSSAPVSGSTDDQTTDSSDAESPVEEDTSTPNDGTVDTSIVEKIPEESNEFTDVYQNPDGTKTAIFSLTPVNYYDETGTLQDIESDLVPVETAPEGKMMAAAAVDGAAGDGQNATDDYAYKTKAGPVEIMLPDNLVSNTPIKMSFDNYLISMMPFSTEQLNPSPNASASPSPSPSASASPSPSPSASATPSPSPSASATPSPSASASATPSPSPSESASPSPSASESASPSPSASTEPEQALTTESINAMAMQSAGTEQPGTTESPSATPSAVISENPAPSQTDNSSAAPTVQPTAASTQAPSSQPSQNNGSVVNDPATDVVAPEYEAEPITKFYDKKEEEVTFKNDKEKNDAIQNGKVAEKTTSLEYLSNFGDGIKVVYTPTNTGIKEDIVLDKYTGKNTFDFNISVGNLIPELVNNTSINFKDPTTNEVVAVIPQGCMYDSYSGQIVDGDFSHITDGVTYAIEKTSETGDYKLTVIADEEFLKNKDTVYPVTIDPSVISMGGGITGATFSHEDDVYDTFVYTNSPDNDVSTWPVIRVGSSGDYGAARGIVNFYNFADTIGGQTVLSAWMCAPERWGQAIPDGNQVQVYRITSGYHANGAPVTWNNQPNCDPYLWAVAQYNSTYNEYNWNLTNLCAGWARGDYPAYGIQMTRAYEWGNDYRDFWCSESGLDYSLRLEVSYKDETSPEQPQTFEVVPNSDIFSPSTGKGNLTVRWSASVERPTKNSGMNSYKLWVLNGATWTNVGTVASTASTYTYTGLNDNSSYTFGITAVDNGGLESGMTKIYDYPTPDVTGPTAPTSFTISTTDWTKNTSPSITWSGITDEGNHLKNVEYSTNNTTWTPIGTNYGVASGSYTLAMPSSDGIYTIYLRGVDSSGNKGVSSTVTYKKDTTKPTVVLHAPGNLFSDTGRVLIDGNVLQNDGLSNIDQWELSYVYGNYDGSGALPTNFTHLASGSCIVNNQNILYAWDTSALIENEYYTLKLTAKDAAGNEATPAVIPVLNIKEGYSAASGLRIDQPIFFEEPLTDGLDPDVDNIDQNVLSTPETNIIFKKISDNTVNGLSPAKLYVNNKLADSETTAGEGLTFNAAAYDENTSSWVYPEGSMAFMYVQAKDAENNEQYSTQTNASEMTDVFNDTSKVANIVSTELNSSAMRLAKVNDAYSLTGSFESVNKQFAGDISYIDLITDQYVPANTSVAYKVRILLDDGKTWEEKDITPVSTNGGKTIDYTKRFYFEENPSGNNYTIKAILTTTSNTATPVVYSWAVNARYTTYANAVLVNNEFSRNSRGIAALNGTYHNEGDGCIQLASDSTGAANYTASGTVLSTVRNTSNNVINACLEVDEDLPAGTDILYEISTQGGAEGTWETIEPGLLSEIDNWQTLTTPGKQIVVRATLTGNGTNTPKLSRWTLGIKEKIAGQEKIIKLVDEPWNLSTLTGANYMTILRWEASETAGVTYNVYRSTTPYFEPSVATRVAEGLTNTYWNDYNLNYDQKFYYKVTAAKMLNTSEGKSHARESLPSNEAEAKVVSEDEVNKKLGLEDYWAYSGFNTGSGTGYINVANGNLVYSATDIVVSDPFLALAMRRTYNSLANTKTPMGYGWDYSFNTCLMREYENTSGVATEKGMILKDGDGSFHRFAKNATGYDNAVGAFMSLEYVSASDEYQIKRNDNIVYHFDAKSMKLKSFSDNNGNQLLFTYDERGNLKEVSNSVGEKITFEYLVEGVAATGADYTYVNYHPDMLKSATWTEGGVADPASITYNYTYDAYADRLIGASTVTEGNTLYQEQFSYKGGKLSCISDPKSNQTSFEYKNYGNVAKVTDANNDNYSFEYSTTSTSITSKYGVTEQYEYDANGLVTKKTDTLGNSVNYSHNGNYLVTGMSYLNTVDGGTTPQTISYSYAYDACGNILIISGPGTYTTYSGYNQFNKPNAMSVKKSDSETLYTNYEYDTSGNLLKTTDPEGKVTTNTYDTVNNHAGYLTQVEGDFGNQTRYEYDAKGRVVSEKEYNNGTYVRTSTTYGYEYNVDGYFLRETSTDAMANSTQTYYDMLGRKVKLTYPDGTNQIWEYDLAGNLAKVTDRKGYEISYSYDGLYRLTGTTYPDSSTNTIKYQKWDSDGNGSSESDKVIKTDGTGISTIEYYDKAGRVIRKSTLSNTSGEMTIAQYQYDMIGNCTQIIDNGGRVTQAQYNLLGQKTKTITDPTTYVNSEGTTVTNPNAMNIINTYSYDYLGNKTGLTDGETNTTTYTYDGDSRLKTVSQTLQGSTLTTSYSYDLEEGGFIKNSTTDAEGRFSQTWFDPMGNKAKDYNAGDTGNSTAMQTDYTYNANNQMSLVTRNDGTKEKYTYDNMGQTVRIDYYETSESTANASDDYITYVYNENGQKTSETVCHGTTVDTTTYSYDSMGRVCQMIQGDGVSGLSITYVYDQASRVTSVSYTKENTPRTIGYVYDGYGRIQKITLKTGDTHEKTVREYIYKSNGDLDHTKDYRDFSNDGLSYIDTAYELNSAGMTTKITYTDHANGATTGIKKEEYSMSYDKRGLITNETAYTNYGSESTVNKTYSYDSLGRLTTAAIGSKTSTYAYDDIGNRTQMTSDGITYLYDYNEFNQLKKVDKKTDHTWLYLTYCKEDGTLGYDGRGNQTYEKNCETGVATSYTYDLMNQMVQADVNMWVGASGYGYPKTYTQTNTYDAAGQRIEQTLAEDNLEYSTTKYYYSNDKLLYTTNSENAMMTENVLELDGTIVASRRFENSSPNDFYADKYYFYNYDMRGSTTNIIKPDGNKIVSYTYDEFGNLEKTGAKDFLNEVTFTGSVSDTTTGLQYMNARFYNPSTGRFLSQDTYTGNVYEPWTQHLYSYCGNNPTNMIDPTGHAAMSASETGHLILDGLGFASLVPTPPTMIIGIVADTINAIWYAAEGDYLNAGLSAAAAIPFVGDIASGAKLTGKAIKFADSAVTVTKNVGKTVTKTLESTVSGSKVGSSAAKAGNKAIVIGEGMGDIKVVAKDLQKQGIDAKWYQAWSKNFPQGRRMTQEELNAALQRNRRWIDSKIKKGYDIYDIGINPRNPNRSPFYELEVNRISHYKYPTTDIRNMRP